MTQKDKERVPENVLELYKERHILDDEGHVEFMGSADGSDYYVFEYDEDLDSGYPFVCKATGDRVEMLEDIEALDAIDLFY